MYEPKPKIRLLKIFSPKKKYFPFSGKDRNMAYGYSRSSMEQCNHSELLKLYEIVHDEKRPKEFICEICFLIFAPCPLNEDIANTPLHGVSCSQCHVRRKKEKFRVVKDSWQETLMEIGTGARFPEKKKRSARN